MRDSKRGQGSSTILAIKACFDFIGFRSIHPITGLDGTSDAAFAAPMAGDDAPRKSCKSALTILTDHMIVAEGTAYSGQSLRMYYCPIGETRSLE